MNELPLVLVVDDDPTMRRYVSEALAARFEVVTAAHGADALARIDERVPDLVVTDVEMPVMRGSELIRALRGRAELDGLPVLVLSGIADDDLRIEMLGAGAQDYVVKPFSVPELVARVSNLVALKRARDILRGELRARGADIEALAREAANKQRELQTALVSVEVARERAEAASRAKTQFLGMVSHEMRTPIMALQLQLERFALTVDKSSPADPREILRRLEASTERLAEVVESLLQYAAMESGRLTVDKQALDVVAVADAVVADLTARAEEKGLRLRRAPGAEAPVETDPRLLRLVIGNLVANAIKFTSSGSVEVSVTSDAGAVRAAVTDTGPGIAPADRARVFEPFEQLEPVRGKSRPGVGLGLALVRDIAAALGAGVELQSELGRGSTFTLVLPR
jgi:signal transduction histidine kinase